MLLLTKYTVLYKENEICCIILLSLPSRERGLKSTKTGIQEANDKMLLEVLKRECEKYPLCMKRCELCKTNRMIEELESTEREENQ